MTLTFVLKIL